MSHLTTAQVAQFERDGFLSPLPAIGPVEAAALRDRLETFEAEHGDRAAALRTDLHLLSRWAWDAVHDDRIVGPVTDLLGPNVVCWSMNWFIKDARDPRFVSFHQDATYWGLEPHDVVTAWVALSDAGPETGPLKFVPGSHRWDLLDHEDTYDEDNLLSRGQRITDGVDESTAVVAPLTAGDMSLHHVRLVHGSDPNSSDDRRIGLVLRYAATHVRQTRLRDTAVLVAGEDTFDHFDLLPRPEVDFGPDEQARHRDALIRQAKAIMPEPPPRT